MATITQNIRQYFETHKHVDELFFTNDHLEENGGDQLAFFKEDIANTHAKNLRDKAVTRITREEAFSEVSTEMAPEVENSSKEEQTTDAPQRRVRSRIKI